MLRSVNNLRSSRFNHRVSAYICVVIITRVYRGVMGLIKVWAVSCGNRCRQELTFTWWPPWGLFELDANGPTYRNSRISIIYEILFKFLDVDCIILFQSWKCVKFEKKMFFYECIRLIRSIQNIMIFEEF